MGAHSNMPQDALDDFHYYSGIISHTFKIQELTKPVVELTLPSCGVGGNSSFDPAANTLIIQYQTPTTTPNGWLRIHAPDVGGSAALLFALLIFFSLHHILRRPQSHGHLYCRNCNYDLTQWQQPTPAQPAGICLECGVSTLAKPPIRGRFITRRILPIWGIFLPLFLLSSILWYSSIELIGPVGPGRTAWPFEALSRISWWTMARPNIPQHYSGVFETYSLPTGEKVSTSVLDPLQGGGRSTSDLRYYAFAEMSEESNWDNLAVVFDPATGHTRSYNMGDNSTGFGYFHGYTPDETEAVYTLTSLANDDGKGAAKIFCVSLDTLAVREIATVNVTYQLIAPSSWQYPNSAVAVNNDPQQWAFLITDGIDAGLLQYSPSPSGELGESKLAVTLPINGGYSSNKLSYSADDKLLFNDGTLEIIPETGAVRPLAVVTHSAKLADVGTLEIYSGANLSQIIQVDPNISYLAANPTFSSDGRWVLVEGYLNNNPTLLGPLTVKFLLFDLSKVQPVDPDSTR